MHRNVAIALVIVAAFGGPAGALAGLPLPMAALTPIEHWEDWTRTASLTHAGSPAGSQFSSEVALDGDVLAVAAPYEAAAGGKEEGAITVWRQVQDEWVLDAAFQGIYPSGRLGLSLAMSGDTIVAGAPGVFVGDGTNSNCRGPHRPLVYVFERTDGTWSQAAALEAPGRCFGRAVDVDGNTLVAADGSRAQAAYIFQRTPSGWVHEQTLSVGGDQRFGSSVAVNDAQGITIVGAIRGQVAYVFERTPGGWVEVAQLRPPPPLPFVQNTCYGSDIVLNEDATVAVVTDPCLDRLPYTLFGVTGYEGAAYVFERSAEGWDLAATLLPGDESAWNVLFGEDLAISGKTIAVGNPWDDNSPGLVATPAPIPCNIAPELPFHCEGAVYVYRQIEDAWLQTDKITMPDGSPGNSLGRSVAVDNDYIAAGAAQGSGIVHFYRPAPFELPELPV